MNFTHLVVKTHTILLPFSGHSLQNPYWKPKRKTYIINNDAIVY